MSNHEVKMKHKINHLSFGAEKDIKEIYRKYGVTLNTELDGTKIMNDAGTRQGRLYVEYVIDITEAEFENLDEKVKGRDSSISGYEYRSMKT